MILKYVRDTKLTQSASHLCYKKQTYPVSLHPLFLFWKHGLVCDWPLLFWITMNLFFTPSFFEPICWTFFLPTLRNIRPTWLARIVGADWLGHWLKIFLFYILQNQHKICKIIVFIRSRKTFTYYNSLFCQSQAAMTYYVQTKRLQNDRFYLTFLLLGLHSRWHSRWHITNQFSSAQFPLGFSWLPLLPIRTQ